MLSAQLSAKIGPAIVMSFTVAETPPVMVTSTCRLSASGASFTAVDACTTAAFLTADTSVTALLMVSCSVYVPGYTSTDCPAVAIDNPSAIVLQVAVVDFPQVAAS